MKRKIAIADTEHGALSARHSGKDGQWALPGTFIEIDWQPNAGWGLSEAHYVAGGAETPINLGVKGFVMPDADVVIGGTFKRFIVQDWTTNDKESSGKVLGIDENGNLTPVEGGGGGGGTTDYNDLENKPSINGVTLQGNVEIPILRPQSIVELIGDNLVPNTRFIRNNFIAKLYTDPQQIQQIGFPAEASEVRAWVAFAGFGEAKITIDMVIDLSQISSVFRDFAGGFKMSSIEFPDAFYIGVDEVVLGLGEGSIDGINNRHGERWEIIFNQSIRAGGWVYFFDDQQGFMNIFVIHDALTLDGTVTLRFECYAAVSYSEPIDPDPEPEPIEPEPEPIEPIEPEPEPIEPIEPEPEPIEP